MPVQVDGLVQGQKPSIVSSEKKKIKKMILIRKHTENNFLVVVLSDVKMYEVVVSIYLTCPILSSASSDTNMEPTMLVNEESHDVWGSACLLCT